MAKTLKQFENISLSDIYHPRLYKCMYDILTLTTAINSLIFPAMIYIIVKHSTKQMGSYKHLMVIQLLFSYIFGIITFLEKPVLIWPLRQAFFMGWIDLGYNNFYYCFMSEIFLIFGIIVAQFFVILFRIVATLKSSFWHLLYGSTKMFYISVITAILLVEIIVIIPIMTDVPETLTVRNYTSLEVPAAEELLKIYPNLAGYHPALEKGGIEFMLGFGFCICSIAPFIFCGVILFFLIRLRNLGKNISNVTYKMEVMLFRALLSQLIILTIFVLIPVMCFILLLILGVHWGSLFSTGCVIFVTFHMFADAISLLFIIKPYQNFVFKKIGILKKKVLSKRTLSRQQIQSITKEPTTVLTTSFPLRKISRLPPLKS